MTTPPVPSITDDQLADIEKSAIAVAKIPPGNCEGNVRMTSRECAVCGANKDESCKRPLSRPYENPKTILAMIARIRELEKAAAARQLMI